MLGRMKRLFCFFMAALLLAAPAWASPTDALGLYTPLTAEEYEIQDAVVAEILALLIREDMSQGEMATVLHDWMVLNCTYGVNPYRDMEYGVLIEGEAVCRGYARAYVLLAEALGFPADYSFSEDLVHAWALVELDGSYYYVDPTWDDEHHERIGFVNHRHIFFSSADERLFSHYGGDSEIWAEGGIYETAPWRAAVSRVIFEGDWAYYLDGEFRLIRCRRDNWATEVLFDRADFWPGFREIDGSEALATGLILLDGRLWFNTPYAICSVDLNGGDFRQEFRPESRADGYICGIDVREGKLVYTQSAVQEVLFPEIRDTGIDAAGAWGCFPVAQK